MTYRFIGSHGQNSDTRPYCFTSEESTNCCRTFQWTLASECQLFNFLKEMFLGTNSLSNLQPVYKSCMQHQELLRNETHLPSLALCRLREALRLRLRRRLLLRLRLRFPRLGERRVTASIGTQANPISFPPWCVKSFLVVNLIYSNSDQFHWLIGINWDQ